MKETIIKTEHDLASELRKILPCNDLPAIRLVNDVKESNSTDALLEVDLDSRSVRLAVEYKLKPDIRDLEHLGQRAKSGNIPLILITVRLTDSIVNHCKQLKINCLDLNGRIWIRAKGLLIDKHEHQSAQSYCTKESSVDFFSLKSSRLARVLLTYRGRSWKQAELAEQTELSQGLLSRLLKYASSQGWVKGEGTRANWQVLEFDSILDAWVKSDRWDKRTTIKQYSTLEKNLNVLARNLLNEPVGQLAFTQWYAASLRFPYAETQVLSVYLRSFPDDQTLEKLRLREVSDGGKLWIIIPTDAGVFQAQQNVQGLPLVSDAQIYLDLLPVGLRGPDQARELRNWERFCQ